LSPKMRLKSDPVKKEAFDAFSYTVFECLFDEMKPLSFQ
jgi:hypothetical protein